MSQEPRPCWIYKSPRKEEMYLYLTAREGFEALPPPSWTTSARRFS